MKNKLKALTLAIMVTLTLTYISCKKSDTAVPDSTTQFTSEADDANRVNNETDDVSNDANTALEASPSFSGGRIEGAGNIICDASVAWSSDSTDTTLTRTITITYNGKNCLGTRTRTGSVVITLPANGKRWSDAGAYVTITFNALTITRLWDNNTLIINGSKTYTNVSGGLLKNLATLQLQHIEHQVSSSNMSLTFNNGTTRTWSIAKQRDFTWSTGANPGVVVTETGFGTDGEVIWGVNRFGNDFSYTITTGQPLVVEQGCDWQLVSGQVSFAGTDFKGLDKTLTVTFGLNAQGNAGTCPGPFYWVANWTASNGKSYTTVPHPY